MAFMSVRKQKRVSASLFDQRKQTLKQKKGRRGSDFFNEEEIEFTKIDQESVPLVESSSNPLEVV